MQAEQTNEQARAALSLFAAAASCHNLHPACTTRPPTIARSLDPQVLDKSHNSSWANGWRAACERIARGETDDDEILATGEDALRHDEL